MENSRGKLTVVIGGQYGSEGKGAIVRHIAHEYNMHVRVGSYNAGHTFYWQGDKHVQQIIPCGWINPDAQIVIGRGAIFPIDGLREEVKHIEKYYPNFLDRLYIDEEAGVLLPEYHEAEGGKDGWFNRKIGSTGEGCGAARMARMRRDGTFIQWKDYAKGTEFERCITNNTPGLIADYQDEGYNILIEGTQGAGLSLLHSHYPYCTSIDTNAAGVISEVGVSPMRVTNVLMVCRTYPIRVAGNSGPMMNEISWEQLAENMGHSIEPEKTTVTKKIRRIAEWDNELFYQSCLLNSPTEIALTFADYVASNIANTTGPKKYDSLPLSFRVWVERHCPELKTKLSYISTGADSVIDVIS